MMSVSLPASRTAGSSTRSPQAFETSYLAASNPKEPAMPQQPGVGSLAVEADLLEQLRFARHVQHGFLMAVSVDDGFALELRWLVVGHFLLQKFAQEPGLFLKPLRVLVIWKKV